MARRKRRRTTTTKQRRRIPNLAQEIGQSAPEYTVVASKPHDDAGDDAMVQDAPAYLSGNQRNLIAVVAGI